MFPVIDVEPLKSPLLNYNALLSKKEIWGLLLFYWEWPSRLEGVFSLLKTIFLLFGVQAVLPKLLFDIESEQTIPNSAVSLKPCFILFVFTFYCFWDTYVNLSSLVSKRMVISSPESY